MPVHVIFVSHSPQEFDYLDSTNELSTHPSLNLILDLKTKWQIRSIGEKERLELWAILLKNISFLVASDLNWILNMQLIFVDLRGQLERNGPSMSPFTCLVAFHEPLFGYKKKKKVQASLCVDAIFWISIFKQLRY